MTTMVTAASQRATALVAMGGDDDYDGDGMTGDGATGYDDDNDGNGQ